MFLGIAMLLSLIAAGLVVLYVAYPHRGQDVPKAPWLGDALAKAADRAPVLTEEDHHLQR